LALLCLQSFPTRRSSDLTRNIMPKITIIGSGNIGLSLAKGLLSKQYCKASDITLTRRNIKTMSIEREQGFILSDNNRQASEGAEDRKSTRLNSSHVKISY